MKENTVRDTEVDDRLWTSNTAPVACFGRPVLPVARGWPLDGGSTVLTRQAIGSKSVGT